MNSQKPSVCRMKSRKVQAEYHWSFLMKIALKFFTKIVKVFFFWISSFFFFGVLIWLGLPHEIWRFYRETTSRILGAFCFCRNFIRECGCVHKFWKNKYEKNLETSPGTTPRIPVKSIDYYAIKALVESFVSLQIYHYFPTYIVVIVFK